MTPGTDATADLSSLGRVHVVGIGGAGMSGIARILVARGVTVSAAATPRTPVGSRRCARSASTPTSATPPTQVDGVDTVVVSTAITEGNAELAAARERGLRVMGRAEALRRGHGRPPGHRRRRHPRQDHDHLDAHRRAAALRRRPVVRDRQRAQRERQQRPPRHRRRLRRRGRRERRRVPRAARVRRHRHQRRAGPPRPLGHVRGHRAGASSTSAPASATATASSSSASTTPGGAGSPERARAAGVDVRTYGESADADFRVELVDVGDDGLARSTLLERGVRLGRIELAVPGRHNVLNATAAFVTGLGLGPLRRRPARRASSRSAGTRRRFDFKGTADGVRVYDDYAHHPTEIAATLARRCARWSATASSSSRSRRTTTTAPRCSCEEFGEALGLADEVVVLEVFAPGEEPIPGASGVAMASHVPLPAGPGRVRAVVEPRRRRSSSSGRGPATSS